ncbi:tagaturonate reductase [Flavobacterium sp. Sd200]|uniref:tagaturonate reductase n=1 Tax=Flavobacterium sp. Sd200 TaxID=2692211 RepID=UPI0013697315|nr:tagaturonate reductase [Flavobacterium sp. Sd200]MXN90074.1 tagaturonate reductase [Flavobacterium sp. Sd200]
MEDQLKKSLSRETTGYNKNLPIKVLQFGGGNFMRAFVDYTIDALNENHGFNAGIALIQPTPRGSVHKLEEQGNLYTLFTRGIKNDTIVDEKRIISAIQKSVNPYTNYNAYLALAEEEELQFLFSNTTEAGIVFDRDEDRLESGPHINFPAKVTAFLYKRYLHFNGAESKGLTIIPCELINNNADTLKEYILKYAALWKLEEGFSEWIQNHNYFHNTLVDRIVPGYPKDDAKVYEEQLDYDDKMMVVSEAFLFWVIQGGEALKQKLPLHKLNEQILVVDDIQPYRTMKVRILNGAHSAMVPFSILYGKETVKESVDDEFTGAFIKNVVFDEIIASLEMNKDEVETFANETFDRFRNPFVKHLLSSIALNSVSKFKVRVIPSLLQYVEKEQKLPLHLTFALAALIRFYKGDWHGTTLPVSDEESIVNIFKYIWLSKDYNKIATLALSNTSFWETDLTEIDGLKEAVATALKEIDTKGIKQAYLDFIKQ